MTIKIKLFTHLDGQDKDFQRIWQMWRHVYEHKTELAPEAIWPVLANVGGWARIDPNIEYVEIEGAPAAGRSFTLKPKGGPRLSFIIGAFDPPHRYSDVCQMPFARMYTTHELRAGVVSAEIRIEGPLSKLWGLAVGRKHAAGLPALTERMLDAARR